ncbi:MAG: hypothetical protein H5T84_09360 [Thermoleophilia bacterium]|nr:hypothetical protein [Thermoleophilia bacterium]
MAATTRETVELAVEGDGYGVIVDQIATSHPFKPNLPIGRVLRDLANATTKVIVAFKSEAERARILALPHPKLTPYTRTDPAEIAAELAKVAEEKVAFDLEEQNLGVCAVAAPIFGPNGDLRAALTLVAPKERFGPRERKKRADAVRETAEKISQLVISGARATMPSPGASSGTTPAVER